MTLFKTAGTLFLLRRSISSTIPLCEFKYKAMDLLKLRYQVMEDPNYGKEASSSSVIPDTLGESVGKQRFELICNLYGEDAFESNIKNINPNATKDNPNLVPCEDWRRLNGCLCKRDQYGALYLLLHKNFPVRCKCGYWFKLVTYEDYYNTINARREKKYNEIKNSSDFKELEANLDKCQAEFDELARNNAALSSDSPGAFGKTKLMSSKWQAFIKARKKIEEVLDDF